MPAQQRQIQDLNRSLPQNLPAAVQTYPMALDYQMLHKANDFLSLLYELGVPEVAKDPVLEKQPVVLAQSLEPAAIDAA